MKKLLFVLCLGLAGFGYGQLTDARDGKTYKTVIIGEQVWMAENLNVGKFCNGDNIIQSTTFEDWKKAGENQQPSWCYYNFSKPNSEKYGKIYNWYAINDPRGLAPKEFHVPSRKEWETLYNQMGGNKSAAEFREKGALKMKTGSDWKKNSFKIGSNESGFSALPGGYIFCDVHFNRENLTFEDQGEATCWWSSTIYSKAARSSISIMLGTYDLLIDENGNEGGCYVRCLKD